MDKTKGLAEGLPASFFPFFSAARRTPRVWEVPFCTTFLSAPLYLSPANLRIFSLRILGIVSIRFEDTSRILHYASRWKFDRTINKNIDFVPREYLYDFYSSSRILSNSLTMNRILVLCTRKNISL